MYVCTSFARISFNQRLMPIKPRLNGAEVEVRAKNGRGETERESVTQKTKQNTEKQVGESPSGVSGKWGFYSNLHH